MRAPRLTLCVIARDAATVLGRCLSSASRIADEVVVVDTGSQDHTAQVARDHEALVVSHVWDDDFAAARNAALEVARGDWVLCLDTDELLPAASAAQLHAAIEHAGAPALRVPIENVSAGGALDSVHLAVRLFRRDPGHRWTGTVRERLTAAQTADAVLPILHHGWADERTRTAKLARDRVLLEREARRRPDDPHVLLHLAEALLGLDAAEAAVATAERGIALDGASGELGLLLLDVLALARAATGRLEAAADTCRIALALRPEWIDPRLLLAQVSRRAGRPREATMHLERWLAHREHLVGDPGWPARFPRLRTIGAEPGVRAELAMAAAALGQIALGRPEAIRAAEAVAGPAPGGRMVPARHPGLP